MIDLKKVGTVFDENQKNFLKEMKHPHIIRFVDQQLDEEYVYIITEYIDGESLFS
jgi:serine/threonine protein kinase